MWKVALKYSLICGAFLLLLFWVSYRFGSNPMIDFKHMFFDLIIFVLFVFFSCKEFKSYRNGGILHFWQGMTLGFLTYAPATVVFAIGITVLFWIDPNLIEDFKVQAIQYMKSNRVEFLSDMSEEQFTSQLERIQTVTSTQMIGGGAFKKFMAGFFVTPVIAIILRKKPN
ncbi:MAG: DUF4199 domain-containing protein [Cytophagales bacterium]|nr:DUF4199 domain-containing protein [Cytophagales bacterium]